MPPEVRPDQEEPLEPDPVIECYKAHVDRTMIREQLRRTVQERVDRMIEALRFAEALRAAGQRAAASPGRVGASAGPGGDPLPPGAR